MKKYIQPTATILALQYEGLVAFSTNDRTPNKDDGANKFSNALVNGEEWDEE